MADWADRPIEKAKKEAEMILTGSDSPTEPAVAVDSVLTAMQQFPFQTQDELMKSSEPRERPDCFPE